MIFRVSKNYLFPDTVSSIRDSITRQRTRSLAALRFDQLLCQSGPQALLTSLESDLGPYLQLQLCDLANMLEVVNNLSEWHAPRATFFTLCFFISCFVITLFGDMKLCMQIIFFILGIVFFLASRFQATTQSTAILSRHLSGRFRTCRQTRNGHLRSCGWRRRVIVRDLLLRSWSRNGRKKGRNQMPSRLFLLLLMAFPHYRVKNRLLCFVVGLVDIRQGCISRPRPRYESSRGKILWEKEWKDLVEVRKVKERDGRWAVRRD
ncbi:hypothetical protein BDD12DRAFT_30352 [Trichophaea hybrida]|nr:hypothetical protein BDD12DRAFT_30352 [Trichophaea hybrida]